MPFLKPLLPTPASVNYQRLFLLRNIAIAGQILVVAWVHYGLKVPLPIWEIALVIGLLIALNILTGLRLGRPWPITDIELFAQLLIDVAALTALLFYSGGPANPFVSLYLLPLIIVATLLPKVYTWSMALITAACYSVLMFNHTPLPHHGGIPNDFNLHLFGMWFTYVLSAALIALFIVRMKATLRERERLLAGFREESMRNERIVALGALAAGAAHELGTPLSTMAVIIREMEKDYAHLPALNEDVCCLQDQVLLCKQTLARLLACSGSSGAVQPDSLPLESYLNDMIEQWRLMRPQVPVASQWTGPRPAPEIYPEQTLGQTLLNLLNNAADASPKGIEVDGRWDEQELTIEIRDFGPGITAEVANRATEPFFTTKAPGQGFGLGLFLANATVERLGGKIRLFNTTGGGACTRLTLPLSADT